MKLKTTVNYDFPNYGLPHESNINLIGLTLTGRKVEHKLPVNINIDPNTFINSLHTEQCKLYAESLENLFTFADQLGLKYSKVTASVLMLNRSYKITFLCYGD